MKTDQGFAEFIMVHFNIRKPDSEPPPCANGFHKRFLGGKPGSIIFIFMPFRFAIGDLPGSENLLPETNILFHHCVNPGYFNNISTDSVDHLVTFIKYCLALIVTRYEFQIAPSFFPTFLNFSMANSICSVECAALICTLILDFPLGTIG